MTTAPLPSDPKQQAVAASAGPGNRGVPRFHLASIDLLRGGAAVAVLLYHAAGFFLRTPVGEASEPLARTLLATFGQGYLGVSLFFIISGFCIHLPHAPAGPDVRRGEIRGGRAMQLGPFFTRRFWRLYPPFFVALLVGIGIAMMKGAPDWSAIAPQFVGWFYGGEPLMVGTDAVSPVFWSLTVEAQLYVLFALSWPVITRLGLGRLTAAMLAFAVLYIVSIEALWPGEGAIAHVFQPRNFTLARAGEWLLGAWLADRFARGRLPSLPGVVAAAVGIGLIEVSFWGGHALARHYESWSVAASIGFAVMLASWLASEQRAAAAGRVPWHARGRFHAVGKWFGDRCYSLYLFHFPTYAIVGEVAARVPGIDKDGVGGTWTWLGVTVIALVCAIIVSDLVYRLVEAPSHRLARRLGSTKPRQPAVGA